VSATEAEPELWRPSGSPPDPAGPLPTFSVVVPTLARKTLPRTLGSIASQIRPGDEILVVCSDENDAGNSARQRGVEAATSSHILFCDDDDVFLPAAFDVIREFAAQHPNAIGLFRRRFNAGPPQWREPVVKPGNLQCMGYVIPNVKGKLGVWGAQSRDPVRQAQLEAQGFRHWSDSFFVTDTAALQDAPIIFCDAIVGHARPEGNPLRRLRYRLALRARVRGLLKSGS
jgi:glycosyltransferase involved in cell wall biosynthesis